MTAHADGTRRSPDATHDRTTSDGDMVFVTLLLWVASLADVVGVLHRGGPFGGLHTLALLALFACTYVLVRALADAVRTRIGAGRNSPR